MCHIHQKEGSWQTLSALWLKQLSLVRCPLCFHDIMVLKISTHPCMLSKTSDSGFSMFNHSTKLFSCLIKGLGLTSLSLSREAQPVSHRGSKSLEARFVLINCFGKRCEVDNSKKVFLAVNQTNPAIKKNSSNIDLLSEAWFGKFLFFQVSVWYGRVVWRNPELTVAKETLERT